MNNGPLDLLCRRDTFAEVLAALEPKEVLIAFLRADGLTDQEIGAYFCCTAENIRYHFRHALDRVIGAVPELASFLSGRDRYRVRSHLTGEGGKSLPRPALLSHAGARPSQQTDPGQPIPSTSSPHLPCCARPGPLSSVYHGSTSVGERVEETSCT